MDKRIILAAAGSGKTYHITNNFEDHQRIILISFTNGNVSNIKKELLTRFNNKIPKNVKVMTFDSFVYNYLLKPFEPISIFYWVTSTGVDIYSYVEDDTRKENYVIIKNFRHFFNENNEYYVSRMSKLFLAQDNNYKNICLARLNKYCDAIYFDEFQDYNSSDFKVIKYLLEKSSLKVWAVGDINQSSLMPLRSRSRNANVPFNKIRNVEDMKKIVSKKILFDEETLRMSRRVSSEICNFINLNLNIKIESISESDGKIIELNTINSINEVMIDENIVKLVWNKKSNSEFGTNFVNWSYSKGDTYDNACVVLTENTSNVEMWKSIESTKTRNALYVALTRSKVNLYLIKSEDYKSWIASKQ